MMEEIERSLIGALMLDGAYVMGVCEKRRVSGEWFGSKECRVVWEAAEGLWNEQGVVDGVLLADRLKKPDVLVFLSECMQVVPTALHAAQYVEKLAAALLKRRVVAGPGGAQPQNGNALQQRAWAVEDRDARYRHEREMQESRAQSALGLQEKQNEGSLAVEQTRAGAQTGVAGIEAGARKYVADKDLAARLGAAETSANAQTTVASLDVDARKYASNKDFAARLGAAETAANAQRDVAATQAQTSRDVANIEAQARAQQSEIAAQAQRDVANINKNASVEVAKLDGETKRQVAEMNALTETIKQNGTAGKTEKQLDSQKRFMELTNMAQKLANGGMEAQDLVVAEAFIDRLDIPEEQKAQKKTELRQGNFAWMVPYIMQQAKDAALAAGYPVPGSEAEAAAAATQQPTPQPTTPAKPKPRKSYL